LWVTDKVSTPGWFTSTEALTSAASGHFPAQESAPQISTPEAANSPGL
jgi:hypothetical protein